MSCTISYEHPSLPDPEIRSKIEDWANYNRFKNIRITKDSEIIIEDQHVSLSSRSWQPDERGIHRIPFKIIFTRDLQFTCAYSDADALFESFPKTIDNSLLFSVGKMPLGVTDLSFMADAADVIELKRVVITSNRGLTSLVGCPQDAEVVEISRNVDMTGLKGITKNVGSELTISMNPKITSFHNIHKHVSRIGFGDGQLILDGCVQRDILGLLLIPGLASILIDNNGGRSPSDDLRKSVNIINTYLKQKQSSHRLFDCYEEMLEIGLDQYARI